jgi:hypothetical protein
MEKMKVSFNVDRELYAEYKKTMIDLRTTPTADLTRHIKKVVDEANGFKEEKNHMFTMNQLDNAFNDSVKIVNFKGGFDSFKFRKGFEEDTTISREEKEKILEYLKSKMKKDDEISTKIKEQIDKQEFASDYYQNPYPKTSRGAYFPVVLKTFAGIMLIDLLQQIDSI